MYGQKKNEWINKKIKLSKWKNIFVIDGLVLEEWIEQLPSVGFWLTKFLQIPSGNIFSLEQFWEEWSSTSKYSISTSLVISGREKEQKELSDFLINVPNVLSIKASTTEEAIAFIAACIGRMIEDLKEHVYAKSIIVENEQDFRQLLYNKNPIIFVVKFGAGSLLDTAVRQGHHILVVLSNDVTAIQANIELSRIRKVGFEQGLKEMGFTDEESEQLTRDSGQSLSVLRRLLKFDKNQQPDWAKDGLHLDIIPVLFAGMWDEEKEEDKSIISLLAGEEYDKFIIKLARWKIEKDAPIFQIKSIWRLTSALDAWSILSPFLTKSNLENFKKAFLIVLPEINPALELEPEDRYLAPIYGKVPRYSFSLKEGLCQSLILLAVFGEQFKLKVVESPQSFADIIIYELLQNASGERWCTIYRLLPLIAEASPTSFLKAVENSLDVDNPPIMQMFGDTDNVFSSTSYYTGLLWALENLLFSPDYFVKTTLLLGRLSNLDPGGKLINRPINTLIATYMPWFRQTQADLELKKYSLEKLTIAEPEIAWKVFLSISPQSHSTVSPIHKCKWRFDTQHLNRVMTNEEVFNFYSFLFDKLISIAKRDEKKTSMLIDFYPNIYFNERDKLIKFLKQSKQYFDQSQNLIWNELRELISKHKEHSQQEWALHQSEIKKLEKVFNLYRPQDKKDLYKYLYDEDWPSFPEGFKKREMSYEQREKLAEDKRKKAFAEIYEQEKLKGIFILISRLTRVHHLARTAAKYLLTKLEEKKILKLLSNDKTDNFNLFTQEYIFAKAFQDESWVKKSWEFIITIKSDPEVLANFFISIPQRREFWDILETASKEVAKYYWQKINPYLNHEKKEDSLYAINRLQEVDRNLIIIDRIAYHANDFSSITLRDILLKAATIKSNENIGLDSYHVGQIFKTLHSRVDLDTKTLAQLEWMYLPFLADVYGSRKPINLHTELKNNPIFFAEVVSYVYLTDNKKENIKLSEEEQTKKYQQADSARKLLESWKDIPGVGEDLVISKNVLDEWIFKARQNAIKLDRVYGVDSEIGKLLACFPRNNTFWPPIEICDIIDSLDSKPLLSHFETEIFNSRGVSVRSPYAGGDQERNLSVYFDKMGKQIHSKYPLTASALFRLGKTYQAQAKDEDESAHLEELR